MPVQPRWRRRWRAWRRRSSFAWWATAIALALLTGLVVRTSLAAAAAGAARYGALRTVPVVVAPVAAGDVVPAGAVVRESRPGATLPFGADLAEAWAGRTALVPLLPGEVLVASKLAPDGLRGAAALLPDGHRALAVPSGPGGRPPVAIGDHVDVLVTLADDAGGESFVVATAALVLAVDDRADTVTVAVPADDAPALASAIATGAVTLALTTPGP
jgi:Flp pilus assembly protein CpaB